MRWSSVGRQRPRPPPGGPWLGHAASNRWGVHNRIGNSKAAPALKVGAAFTLGDPNAQDTMRPQSGQFGLQLPKQPLADRFIVCYSFYR